MVTEIQTAKHFFLIPGWHSAVKMALAIHDLGKISVGVAFRKKLKFYSYVCHSCWVHAQDYVTANTMQFNIILLSYFGKILDEFVKKIIALNLLPLSFVPLPSSP